MSFSDVRVRPATVVWARSRKTTLTNRTIDEYRPSARDFAGVARMSTRAGRADLRAVAPSFGTRRAMLRARPWGSVRRALYRRFASRRDTRATRRVMSTAAAWDGSGTQEDLMYRDECILVVRRDRLGRPTP
jgi:hypothetical protein